MQKQLTIWKHTRQNRRACLQKNKFGILGKTVRERNLPMKARKKILALFLALTLICTSFGSLTGVAWAADVGEQADEAVAAEEPLQELGESEALDAIEELQEEPLQDYQEKPEDPKKVSTEEESQREYLEWKSALAKKHSNTEDPEIKPLATYQNLFGNQYVEAYVDDDGLFTMGTAGGKKLLYGHPNPWSSFTTIRVGNINYEFEADEPPQINAAGTEAVSTMVLPGAVVKQRITIVNNPSSLKNDLFRIRYEISNTSGASQSYGTRILLDTQLGENDGSPFVIPGIGAVTTEREFTGSSIPRSWYSVDDLQRPTVTSVGLMYLSENERPDKVQFCHWASIYDTAWNYSITPNYPVTGDSAVSIYFNPQSCAAGQTRTVTTYYGLSSNTATTPKKKAIYVLPGYLGSELYDNHGSGDKLWVDYLSNAGFWSGDKKNKFIQDSNGNPGELEVNRVKDKYGANNEYETLVKRLVKDFDKSNGGEYDVIFWPYNWLGDLNDSLTKLEDNIDSNKYTDVVFVTHSTGGLLASAYIAKDEENKRRVKKAILIAAPLFGTYASLLPIERGDSTKTGNPFTKAFWIDALTQNSWIRSWAHNSPTTYQLLPSDEYLKHNPLEGETGWFSKNNLYASSSDFYKVLNQSDRINTKLTNGGNRSHQYFRNTTLRSNVLGQWSLASLLETDALLIGTTSGHSTPSVAVYSEPPAGKSRKLKDVRYDKDGDGTVQGFSAKGKRFAEAAPIPGDFSFTASHGGLIKDTKVLDAVSSKISSGSTGSGASTAIAPLSADAGMSEQLKIRYVCDTDIDATVYDAAGHVVASANGFEHDGFDGENFIYDSFSDDTDSAEASIYLPNQGYKIVFSHGNAAGVPVDFQCEASTLVADGYKEVSVQHSANTTTADGVILTLDGTAQAILGENISSKITGDVVGHYTEWELQDVLKMNLGETQSVNITGNQAGQAAPLLSWTSSDEDIVEVSDSGVLTAKGYGVATIAATDGNKSSVCQVTVMQNATSVSLIDIDMDVDERTLIRPQFIPATATETNMTYSVSADGIIDINEHGVIHALTAGAVIVTGKTSYGVQDQFTVTVVSPDDNNSVAADKASLTWNIIKNNNSSQNAVTTNLTLPTTGAHGSTITWVSSNSFVISATGVCTRPPYASGDRNVTLTAFVSKGNVSDIATFNVVVTELPFAPQAIALNTNTRAEISMPGALAWFKYTPTTAMTVAFYSTGSEDTYGYIYNSSKRELAHDDDGGAGSNFSIRYNLQAGQTYYFAAKYFAHGRTGNFTVRLDKVETRPLTSISLNKTALTLKNGERSTLTVAYSPANTTDNKTVVWSTSNKDIATVANGVVTANKVGTATITAKVGSKTATCSVKVTQPLKKPTGLKLKLGAKKKLASWKKVKNNNGYVLKVMQGKNLILKINVKKNKTSYTFSKKQLGKLKKGTKYTVTLVAKGSGNYTNSPAAKSKASKMK
jgi:uncharacterized protein YjdB/pimeloyl-ACP methyl ester carboxylesterase